MRKRMSRPAPIVESSLAEILSDPITQALMQADGISAKHVRAAVALMRRPSGTDAPCPRPLHGPTRPGLAVQAVSRRRTLAMVGAVTAPVRGPR